MLTKAPRQATFLAHCSELPAASYVLFDVTSRPDFTRASAETKEVPWARARVKPTRVNEIAAISAVVLGNRIADFFDNGTSWPRKDSRCSWVSGHLSKFVDYGVGEVGLVTRDSGGKDRCDRDSFRVSVVSKVTGYIGLAKHP
jgi:hypothetical protein